MRQYIVLHDPVDMANAEWLTKLTKVAFWIRQTLFDLANSQQVEVNAARNAVFYACAAAATAKGQSLARRADRDRAIALWESIQRAAGESITAPAPARQVDLTNPAEVEAWLQT